MGKKRSAWWERSFEGGVSKGVDEDGAKDVMAEVCGEGVGGTAKEREEEAVQWWPKKGVSFGLWWRNGSLEEGEKIEKERRKMTKEKGK